MRKNNLQQYSNLTNQKCGGENHGYNPGSDGRGTPCDYVKWVERLI